MLVMAGELPLAVTVFLLQRIRVMVLRVVRHNDYNPHTNAKLTFSSRNIQISRPKENETLIGIISGVRQEHSVQ